MSTTHSVAKLAASKTDQFSGITYYALFEKTFSSNTEPRTPDWSAMCFGTAEQCMKNVVRWSASCEGGSLKGTQRDILPESYIRQWRRAMAQPGTLLTTNICIPMDTTIPDVLLDRYPVIRGLAASHGIELQEMPGFAGFLFFSLEQRGACEFLADLTANKVSSQIVSPWRILTQAAVDLGSSNRGVVYSIKPSPTLPSIFPKTVCIETPHQPSFLVELGGKWQQTGAAWSTVYAFIQELAVEAETNFPGSAERLIRNFRDQVRPAPVLPGETVIVCSRDEAGTTRWAHQIFDRLCSQLGLAEGLTVFQTTLEDVRQAHGLDVLESLNAAQVEIRVPRDLHVPVAHQLDIGLDDSFDDPTADTESAAARRQHNTA